MSCMKIFFRALVLLVCIIGTKSRANIVLLEPDDYAAGTNVTSAIPFVSLWTFRSNGGTAYAPTFSPVFVADCNNPYGCAATTGSRVFRDGFGGNIEWGAFGTGLQGAGTCLRHLGLGET